MISDAIIGLVTWLLEAITSTLEVGPLELPAPVTILNGVSGFLGPFDAWAPVHEMAMAAVFVVTVFLPMTLVYALVSWVYRHIPVVGGG